MGCPLKKIILYKGKRKSVDLYLREATEEDIKLLYEWANDVEVRKNSFASHDITWEEHQKWFKEMLCSTNIRQYIFMCGGQGIGQIRLTVTGEQAEVGYSIAKEFRCMGYAKQMVSCLVNRVKEEMPEVRRLVARVKPDNVASQKVFLDLGYQEKCSVFELDMDICGMMITNVASKGTERKFGGGCNPPFKQ